MRARFITSLAVTLLLLCGQATAHKCGMAFAMQNKRQKPYGTAARVYAKDPYTCEASAYYDSVYTRETEHFQIFYTLGEGPHSTTPEFVDSIAVSFEKAFVFHTKTLGMLVPQGLDTTSHYQKSVKQGLYPIEIAEIDFLRDPYSVLHSKTCNGCFGVTYTDNRDSHKSAIIIDNDFLHVPLANVTKASIERDGKQCSYPVSSETIYNPTHNYPYSDEWAKAIRVTAFHELYHAVQLRYIDYNSFYSFWLEASASGIEEITAPDIDDYFREIGDFLYGTRGTPLDQTTAEYGAGVLFLYLYNHFDKRFDKSIWEGFSKSPSKDFRTQLQQVISAKKQSPDSVFHGFATKIAFSGKRASTTDSSSWISRDQSIWPEAPYTQAKNESPDIPQFSYIFYSGIDIDLNNFYGKASVSFYKNGKATIFPITNTLSIDSVKVKAFQYDSLTWILSRFGESEHIPEVVKDSTLRAFPTPWRHGNLCFTPLPLSKEFIEIRNARGDLVMREKYTHTTHCIDEASVMDKMKPGVYRFRAGASGKTEKFLIVY